MLEGGLHFWSQRMCCPDAPGVMNCEDLPGLSRKGTSASVLIAHLNSTVDPELNQAEFVIPRRASFQRPDGYLRPGYAVVHFKGRREGNLARAFSNHQRP